MTPEEILAIARPIIAPVFDGNLIVTGADAKHPQGAQGLVGLAAIESKWMRSIGLGRGESLNATAVEFAAKALREQIERKRARRPTFHA